tara:strand:- start:1202 stop:1621 length:420 start_codon:yes stop_codon:yes gene_type:complete
MTRISFYISRNSATTSRLSILFRIVEKAYFNGHHIFITSDNENETKKIDAELWSFKANRFIPHGFAGTREGKIIGIGCDQEPHEHSGVLINLQKSIPAFFPRFERLIEIVESNDEDLARGRANWIYYKDRGYPLDKYEI